MSTIRPRSDTCKVCDTFKVQTTAEEDEAKRKQLLCEWDLHKTRAQNAYHRLKEDTMYAKFNPDVVLLSFDLQLSLPHIYQQMLCFTNARCGRTTLAYMMEGTTNVPCICGTRVQLQGGQ